MTDSLDATKESIADLLRQLFDIRRQRAQLKNEYNDKETKRKRKFDKKDTPLAEQQAAIMAELYQLVTGNRTSLLSGTLKSFAMIYGKVSFKGKRLTFKITDKTSVEKLARKDRILNTVGSFERAWKPDPKKLEAWLENHPVRGVKYEPFVERDGGYDEVFAQPNGVYLTKFDPDRLSDKSIKLEPAADVKDV